MEIGGKICSPSGAVIFVAKYGVNLRSPSGAVIFVFWAWNTYYRPAGAWKIIHNAKATNMDAPLGLYLSSLIHSPRQKNVPRHFEILIFTLIFAPGLGVPGR